MSAAPHPSRSLPVCTDCQHHVKLRGIKPACNHPSQPVHLDEGNPFVWPATARMSEGECAQRGWFFCGPSGIGFVKRVGNL